MTTGRREWAPVCRLCVSAVLLAIEGLHEFGFYASDDACAYGPAMVIVGSFGADVQLSIAVGVLTRFVAPRE
jgi:hypothetical protein